MSETNPRGLGDIVRFRKFSTIDEIVDALDRAKFFDRERADAVLGRWKKQEARRLIKTQKDENGWPVWASIEIDKGGKTIRVYAQESLFDLEMYRQVIDYHKHMGHHHMAAANEYTRRARAKFGAQLRLPFPGEKRD